MTPRPKISDPAVIAAAAKMLAPKVLAWAGRPLPDVEADLSRAIARYDDGYFIALSMDLDGYGPNAALVAILDQASWLLHVAADAVHMARLKTQPEEAK